MKNIEASQFSSLILANTPWIDVRAPIEFNEGSMPVAVNLPLLNDDERAQVGTRYKEQGQAAAIELGHELVHGPTRQKRTQAWLDQIAKQPDAVIYCFRGGLRSQTVQEWLRDEGMRIPIVVGGYKALRGFLLQYLDDLSQRLSFEIVSGPTGSGKTKFLRESGRLYVDLEEIARHRGSAFGATESPQPSQVDFENQIGVALLRLTSLARVERNSPILIEDESRMIGKRIIPLALFEKMRNSPRLELQVDLEKRVENIFQDYIVDSSLGKSGDLQRFDVFSAAVASIAPKLGDARAREVQRDLQDSKRVFVEGRDLSSNRIWIRKLLEWYYDPVYRRSSEKRR